MGSKMAISLYSRGPFHMVLTLRRVKNRSFFTFFARNLVRGSSKNVKKCSKSRFLKNRVVFFTLSFSHFWPFSWSTFEEGQKWCFRNCTITWWSFFGFFHRFLHFFCKKWCFLSDFGLFLGHFWYFWGCRIGHKRVEFGPIRIIGNRPYQNMAFLRMHVFLKYGSERDLFLRFFEDFGSAKNRFFDVFGHFCKKVKKMVIFVTFWKIPLDVHSRIFFVKITFSGFIFGPQFWDRFWSKTGPFQNSFLACSAKAQKQLFWRFVRK